MKKVIESISEEENTRLVEALTYFVNTVNAKMDGRLSSPDFSIDATIHKNVLVPMFKNYENEYKKTKELFGISMTDMNLFEFVTSYIPIYINRFLSHGDYTFISSKDEFDYYQSSRYFLWDNKSKKMYGFQIGFLWEGTSVQLFHVHVYGFYDIKIARQNPIMFEIYPIKEQKSLEFWRDSPNNQYVFQQYIFDENKSKFF